MRLPETIRRFPSSRGADVVAYDWGGPTGAPTLLFAHATGLNGHIWLPLAARLRATFRCVALDLRGHGAARRPDDGVFSWDGYADDMVAALDGLALSGRGDVHGIGHSLGGATLCLGELAHPGTFARLFLYEPIVFPPEFSEDREGPNRMAVLSRKRRTTFASRDVARANFAGKPPFNTVDAEVLDQYIEHGFIDLPDGTIGLACRAEDEAATFEGAHIDLFARVPAIVCPVTLAIGRDSEPHHTMFGELQVTQFARARVIWLPGRTHFGVLEDTPDMARVVLDAFADDPG